MFSDIIKYERFKRGWSLEQMAKFLNTSKQALSHYELNQRTPKITVAYEFSKRLGVSLEYLIDNDNSFIPGIYPDDRVKRKVKVIGAAAAGEPVYEESDEWIDVDDDKTDAVYTVEGDSMEPTLYNGDKLFIHRQSDCDDGQIAVVMTDEGCRVKRIRHAPGGLMLISDNTTKYPPVMITENNSDYCYIVGVVHAFRRIIK